MKRFRYSAWDGTQVVPDLDTNELLDELRDDYLTHGDLQAALRRLFKEGFREGFAATDADDIQGLREMIERLRERRRELLDRHDPDGILDDIKERLDEIRRLEEDELDRRVHDDPGDSVAADGLETMHRLPDSPGERLRELAEYDFQNSEAGRRFDELMQDLREQAMQQFSQGLVEGIRSMSPEDMARMKDMMAELNEMLNRRAAGEDPDFEGFMGRYGDFFPENPQSLDELLAQMAQRMARMQMLLASMSDEQRAELEAVLDTLMDDMDLQWQAGELARSLAEAFPDLASNQGYDFTGGDPLDIASGMRAMDALGEMDDLESFLGQATNPAMLSEIDPDQVGDLIGEDARRSLERLQQITKALEEAGLIENTDGEFKLTPEGMRRVGQKTLRELFADIDFAGFGEHDQANRGALGEPTYTTRQYTFGDPFLLDVRRTVHNAVVRGGPGTPVRVSADDFEVAETERRTRTATVLMLDLSLSMMLRDNFLAAKKVAVALQSLISSKFPRDYLGIVGFSEVAREIAPDALPEASYDYVYGTNMQHAFVLARNLLARHRGETRQIVMITDGEPTAHIEDGMPIFNYPPTRQTVEETLREVVRATREKITINTFMLDASPALGHFVERMTEMNRGRAFFTTPETLGRFVLVDFLDNKRRQRRS